MNDGDKSNIEAKGGGAAHRLWRTEGHPRTQVDVEAIRPWGNEREGRGWEGC